MKINNVVRVPSASLNTFIKYWIMFLQPIHKLSVKESDVFAFFLEKYLLLQDSVKDSSLITTLLLNKETKKECMEKLELSRTYFYVLMHELREKNVIDDNGINMKFIPNITSTENGQNCSLLLYFDLLCIKK